MLVPGLTNLVRVVPDKAGPLPINVVAAEIAELDASIDCPHEIRAARTLLHELYAKRDAELRRVHKPSAESLRRQAFNEKRNAALQLMATAIKMELRPENFMLPVAQNYHVSQKDLDELERIIAQLNRDVHAFKSKYADYRNPTPAEKRLDKMDEYLKRALTQIINATNREIARLHEEIDALKATPVGDGKVEFGDLIVSAAEAIEIAESHGRAESEARPAQGHDGDT